MAKICRDGAERCAHCDNPSGSGSPRVRDVSRPGHADRSVDLKHLANRVHALMASGCSALDEHLLRALVDLGNEAQAVARLASEHAVLSVILQELHAYALFDATGTECDGTLVVLKLRARRAACGAPAALWDPQAERELLEAMLQAKEEDALDRVLLDLADASGYVGMIDVSWSHWHYGRHAEHAQELGMDSSLQRLLSAGWQIQHDVLGAPDSVCAKRMRTHIRAQHLAAVQSSGG
jgi:hypothetical protein